MMFSILDIKPLSVNEGYAGRRWKTERHREWARSVHFLLPKNYILPPPPYEIYIRFGVSNMGSDWDNGCKFFQDCLANEYGFNDKLIHRAVIEKTLTKKGKEFIQWELKTLITS